MKLQLATLFRILLSECFLFFAFFASMLFLIMGMFFIKTRYIFIYLFIYTFYCVFMGPFMWHALILCTFCYLHKLNLYSFLESKGNRRHDVNVCESK